MILHLGLILVSIRRSLSFACYGGDVLGLPNQSDTKINANNRIAAGLNAFKKALTPSFSPAFAA